MPDGQGSALDVLDRAAARGLDVRVLFWRPDQETARYFRTAFWGSDEHLAMLALHNSGIKARWDRAKTGYCQHQNHDVYVVAAGVRDQARLCPYRPPHPARAATQPPRASAPSLTGGISMATP